MKALREVLADLIGAEVQEHSVEFGVGKQKRTKKLRFRQISDAEAKLIYAPGPEGEDAESRGRRAMVGLVAYSLLSDDDESGSKLAGASPEERSARLAEAEKLPGAALVALYNKAALTNGIVTTEDDEEAAAPADGEPAPKG